MFTSAYWWTNPSANKCQMFQSWDTLPKRENIGYVPHLTQTIITSHTQFSSMRINIDDDVKYIMIMCTKQSCEVEK